ncbi:MAG: hypothetical protein AB2598_01595 [Candidatus Thiodiazotropha sp.]
MNRVVRHKQTRRIAGLRKQYYFSSSSRGLCAWDVERLIKLTKDIEPELIPLNTIKELDENHWFGEEGDTPTCRAITEHAVLIKNTDLSFPIILSTQGRVMDGMHRVCRALMEGKEKIKAVRFAIDPEPDYVGVRSADDLPYQV